SASAEASSRKAADGPWGATGVALEVTASGGKIEYDCAHGTITEPIVLDDGGRFDVKGLHYREHGGPIRDGEESAGDPVRYAGQIQGDTMNLKVSLEGRDSVLGTYTLVRGKTGRLRKCG
ncbi:MAG TPA: hypothetical protein VKH43_10300, partial [Thermoanaerobaculia bacterium]|nr:hypothetical protein [Thermoanaerobaculia bacterium]